MSSLSSLLEMRDSTLALTRNGPPNRTSNQFFGVGPITDGVADEVEARLLRFEFEHWLEQNYRKLDDKGRDIGPFTAAEMGRSMHRGYPADKVILDMMREIHRYFGFPKENRMAVGLGGGHSGFTVCALHLISPADSTQHIFVDTPAPESASGKAGGFFRQSWGAQIIEMMRLTPGGDESRLHFAGDEGHIPEADKLMSMGVKLVFGVGHETTGATTYSDSDIENLLAWIDRDPTNHHAVLDATSLLGAMPWKESLVQQVMKKCCFFMPFQKAIGGISGYYVASFTPHALALVEANQKKPGFAIPRQLKLAAPVDAKLPLSGERTIAIGPFYDAAQDKMLGGVINTYSILAFAETTFGLLRMEKRVGDIASLNRRSAANRAAASEWVGKNDILELGVTDPSRRGAAVTLLKVNDTDITDPAVHARIIQKSKQLLSYDGNTHVDGSHETGLDVARYINAFPGTPGDYRAWIGGIRPAEDVDALFSNIRYAYLRAKLAVLEEELQKLGHNFPVPEDGSDASPKRVDDPARAYKVLVCDLVGLRFDANGKPDPTEVKAYIEAKGGSFHLGDQAGQKLQAGKIHFFYLPDISTEDEILPLTNKGQYDAVIAAATFLPKNSRFELGGVRIGAGTGNMSSASWGGGNGAGGEAPLMNTPSFNSRATAQMTMKSLLRFLPDLPVQELHQLSVAGKFDTGKDLKNFPTEKLEGKTIAIIGYGNIGREVAHLAMAFGMRVKIHARPKHKVWIESEGFEYCASVEEAAKGSDVVSIHTGLGPKDSVTGRFANERLIGSVVLDSLCTGAVLLNFDRGECVDVKALDAALASGKLRAAAIDADLFKTPDGNSSGPLAPYLPLARKYRDRIDLIPHAAADTDHPSRVAGAKQAVDQIFDCIQFKHVKNLKGDLPAGYYNAGAKTVPGVGKVTAQVLSAVVADKATLSALRKEAESMAALWAALETTSPRQIPAQVKRHGAKLTEIINRYQSMTRRLGLWGPFEES
ncbi:MAG: phosphoglycerate dehydrogenase [Alphaproteobacteria bacterium]|nr:phosphoglycerate dehydrogenase [Alphaproteobacteria bacterium]